MADKRPLIGITMDADGEFFKLRRQYVEAVRKAGGIPLLIPCTGAAEGLADAVDGLLIPGGDDIAPKLYGEPVRTKIKLVPEEKTDLEINLIHEIIKLRKPLLGICYGMQVINTALGGRLHQDIKAAGKRDIDHRKDHEVDIKKGSPLTPGMHTVNSSHHQAVKTLGAGLDVLATSPDGLIEAFWMKDYPFLIGVQWHPERLSIGLSSELFGLFVRTSHVC